MENVVKPLEGQSKLQTHVKRHHYGRVEARGNDLPVGDTGE